MKVAIILFSLLLPLFLPAPALAAEPPTSIDINTVDIYRNLAESGDVLIVFHYSMPYSSDNYTDTPASETIIFRLYSSNATDILQTNTPYVNPFFGSNGYGEGVGSIYFAASDNYTWAQLNIINIYGWPAYFSSNLTQSYTLTLTDYTTQTTQDANRELLSSWIFLECDKLAADYEDTGIVLKTSSDTGIVLSSYGELYFKGAIPGLQNLCPDIFFIQTLIPTTIDVDTYDMSLMDTYTNRLVDDDIGEGFDEMGEYIGVSGGVAAAVITFILTIVLSIWTSKKNWGAEIGLIGGALIATVIALLVGDIVFTVLMIGSLLAAIGIIWVTILKKA